MDPNQNPFLQRVNRIHSQEDKEAQLQAQKKRIEEQRREKEAAEAEIIARSNVDSIKRGIAEVLQHVRRDFSIPEHSQKGADIEVVINSDWLMTVRLTGTVLEVALYNLIAQHNPRMREQSGDLDYQEYKLELQGLDDWHWRSQRKVGKSLTRNTDRIFSISDAPNPSSIHTRDMQTHILNHFADVLEWTKKAK